MLNLAELESRLDDALSRETPESLRDWIQSVELRECGFNRNVQRISQVRWHGISTLNLSSIEQVNALIFPECILGLSSIPKFSEKIYNCVPIDNSDDPTYWEPEPNDTKQDKIKKTPIYSESSFFT